MPFELDADWRPNHGGLRHEFHFDPLHYGVGGVKQHEFKDRMQQELRNYGFIFAGEVHVSWRLFVEEQDRWEGDNGADVDNFAKLLNDGLVGANGLLFDDVQIQALSVSWQPTINEASFDLDIQCSPDDWVTRPAEFYELSDRLWYPLSTSITACDSALSTALYHLDNMVRRVVGVRHQIRRTGRSRREAFEATRPLSPIIKGFHKTRVSASSFPTVPRKVWMDRYTRPSDLPAPTEVECQTLAGALVHKRCRS